MTSYDPCSCSRCLPAYVRCCVAQSTASVLSQTIVEDTYTDVERAAARGAIAFWAHHHPLGRGAVGWRQIQARLDKLDNAFLFEEKIDSGTYERQRDRLREEMTVAKMAKHSSELDELDVEGILAFAERVLPRASAVWIQASLAQRQQQQKLFFPEGIRFDGTSIVRTPPRPSASTGWRRST